MKTAAVRTLDRLPPWTQLAAFTVALLALVAMAVSFVHPDGYLVDFGIAAGAAVLAVVGHWYIGTRGS